MAGDLQRYIDNWIRWARQSPGPRQYRSPLGRLYIRSKDEMDENGEWVSTPSEPVRPIDEKEAKRVNDAILSLPTDRFDQPKLIVWHFIHSKYSSAKAHYITCRKMRIKARNYDECLKLALANLEAKL